MKSIFSNLLSATLLTASLLACGSDGNPANSDAGVPDASTAPTFDQCTDSDQAFVRSAHLALLGYRPKSQASVNVYSDLMAAIRKRNLEASAGDAGPLEAVDPYATVARMLLRDPAYLDRWAEHFMDALQVPRIEDQSMQSCYGDRSRKDDAGALAGFVRDAAPMAGGDGQGEFTMLDLLRSSLILDDVSPVYRAHIMAMVSRPIPAANVPLVQAELARREDFGLVFDATYLNRDITCLGCHNSTASITDNADPALRRHWDLPGLFEEAIYGEATGVAPERAHAAFRFDGFVADRFFGETGNNQPWDWDLSCGGFFLGNLSADPAGIDGRFASLSGDRSTVYDLEQSLRSGFESIANNGLTLAADESIADPDAAFAYLVASNIVDGVWAEVIGSRLTIANHFPRNEQSRDLLLQLTESFVKSHFSVKELLVAIVTSAYFNRLEPAAGCGASPYSVPPVFDPWTIAEEEANKRANSSGDGVVPLSARTLLSAAYGALDWRRPFFESFPERPDSINQCAAALPSCSQMKNVCQNQGQCCLAEKYWCQYEPSDNEPDTDEQRLLLGGLGVFLKPGDRGFRGLDFQARLVFEDRFGACRKTDPQPDFIDGVLAAAAATPGSTLGDLVAAVKDRIIGQARIDHQARESGLSELAGIELFFGASVDTAFEDVSNLNDNLRGYCGMLLSTPQFLLSGLAAPESRYEPLLTPADYSYQEVCGALQLPSSLSGSSVQCEQSGLTLSP